jgi:hypothetical protein
MTGQVILILVVGGQATLVSFLKNKQNKTKNQSNTYGYMAKDLCCYATLIKYVWLYGQGPVLLRQPYVFDESGVTTQVLGHITIRI